jgi:hypothetical protein
MEKVDRFQPVRHGMFALCVIAGVLAFGLARRITGFPLTSTIDLLLFGNVCASLVICGLGASTYLATLQREGISLMQNIAIGFSLCFAVLSGFVLYTAAQQSTMACYASVGVTLPIVAFSAYGLLKLQGIIARY